MKLYKYNHKTLKFEKIPYLINILKYFLILIGLFLFLEINTIKYDVKEIDELENMMLIELPISFSEEKLIDMIKEINFKYPYIVLAQIKLETGNFTSDLFLENNNLIGMKEATVRLNTAICTRKEHAYYNNWKESLLDYALYYATYLQKLDEKEIYQYLNKYYAEDPDYIDKLKDIINREGLEMLF